MAEWKVRISPKPGSGQCMIKEVTVDGTSQQDARLTCEGMYPDYKQVSAPQRVGEVSNNRQYTPSVNNSTQNYTSSVNNSTQNYTSSSASPDVSLLGLLFIGGVFAVGMLVNSVVVADQQMCNPQCQVERQVMLKKVGINFPINVAPKPQPKDEVIDTSKVIQEREARLEQEQQRRLARDLKAQELKAQELKAQEPPVLPAIPVLHEPQHQEPQKAEPEPQGSYSWTNPNLSPEERKVVDSLPDGPNDVSVPQTNF